MRNLKQRRPATQLRVFNKSNPMWITLLRRRGQFVHYGSVKHTSVRAESLVSGVADEGLLPAY